MITAALLALTQASAVRELPLWGACLSADGNVIAGTIWDKNNGACLWTPKGGLVRLGITEGGHAQATDLSANGSTIVGWVERKGQGYSSFVWRKGQGIKLLAGRDGGVEPAVSPDGHWVSGQGKGSYRWSEATGVQYLPSAAADKPYGGAAAIANTGMTVGFSDVGTKHGGPRLRGMRVEDGSIEACVWKDAWNVGRLGRPGPFYTTQATACSADGLLLCGFGVTKTGDKPFKWSQEAGLTLLPMPKGFVSCEAYGMTTDGRFIFGGSGHKGVALIWSDAFGVKTVKEYAEAAGVQTKGWELWGVTGVSDDGKVIVGHGVNPKGKGAFWIADLR